MKKLILAAVFSAAFLLFACGVHADQLSETSSVLVEPQPLYTLAALDAPAAAPVKVLTVPEQPHFFVGPGDPFAGTWWDGFWSEHLHGNCMHPYGGHGHPHQYANRHGGGFGGRGACGGHGGCRGRSHCGGRADVGRCGCRSCNCHDGAGSECGCVNQDAADTDTLEPELDVDFDPVEPDAVNDNSGHLVPQDPATVPEVPRRVTPPRNVLPKNALDQPQPAINSAAAHVPTVPQKTVLRFRFDAVAHPVIRDPETETADVLFRKTLR